MMNNAEPEPIYFREIDHERALRATKVGNRVARIAVWMADRGIDKARIPSILLGFSAGRADSESVALVARSELSSRGRSNVGVSYTRTYDPEADVHDSIVQISSEVKPSSGDYTA